MRITILTLLLVFAITHSKAQIIYTDVKPGINDTCSVVGCQQAYYLDLNNDGINDFEITETVKSSGVPCPTNKYVWITSLNSNKVIESKLLANSVIDSLNSFDTGAYYLRKLIWTRSERSGVCLQNYSGEWVSGDGYLGLQLKKGSNVYYGWIHLNVSVTSSYASFTVKNYAYNSNANQPILAGQKTNFNWVAVTALSSQSPYCPGKTIKVSYAAGGSFKTSNVFTAQLSDSIGSFTKPVIIGNKKSSSSGSINAVIPAKTSPGTQYRIRVVSSNSSDSSYNNGKDLVIGAGIYATAPTEFCYGGAIYLVAPSGYSYKWHKNGKLIPGENSYELVVNPSGTDAPGVYTYKCIITGMCGRDTSNAITVTIHQLPKAGLVASGPTTFCKGGSVTLTDTAAATGLIYKWTRYYIDSIGDVFYDTIPGATHSYYTTMQPGNYTIIASNKYGCTASAELTVSVPGVPQAYIYNTGDSNFCSSDSTILQLGVNADSSYQFQWKKNGVKIAGATLTYYVVKTAGTYTCKVNNLCYSILTNSLTITTKQCNPSSIISQIELGGTADDALTDMHVTSDGGLIAGGTSYSNISYEKTDSAKGNGDYWIVKMNKNGAIQWSKTIGGSGNDNFKSVIQTSDGGYAVIGESQSNISYDKTENSRGSSDYWLVKLDSKGNIQWDKTIGGSGTEYIDHIVQTNDGGYILAGSSNSPKSGDKTQDSIGYYDYWVVKLDKNGKKLWDKTIGGTDYDWCSPVALTNDGGVILGGFSLSNISGNKTENSKGGYDYWLVKLDASGNIQWDKTIGGDGYDYCHGLVQTADSGYIIGGSSLSGISGDKTDSSRGDADYWAVKIDKNRNIKWDKTVGGNADDWCNVMIKTTSNTYMLMGGSLSSASGDKQEESRGGADYWMVNIDSSGHLLGEKTIGGIADDWGGTAAQVSTNTFYIGGTSYSPVGADKTEFDRGGSDYWIVKLNYENSTNNTNIITKNVYSLNKSGSDKLFTVYPNPFSNSAVISFNLTQPQKVSVTIYDINGRLIKTLADAQMQQGNHQLTWNARDEKGTVVIAGIYLLKMQAGNYTETKELLK